MIGLFERFRVFVVAGLVAVLVAGGAWWVSGWSSRVSSGVDVGRAERVGREFVLGSADLWRGFELSEESFLDSDRVLSKVRVDACLSVQGLLSEGFGNSFSCYSLPSESSRPWFPHSLVLSKVSGLSLKESSVGSDGVVVLVFSGRVVFDTSFSASLDQPGDGGGLDLLRKSSGFDFDGLRVTVKDGRVTGSNIGAVLQNFSFLWDGGELREADFR